MTMGNEIGELTKNMRLVDDLATRREEMGIGDYLYPSINSWSAKIIGKSFPKEKLSRDWCALETLSEIDIERAVYLLNMDDVLEEELNMMSV